MTTLVHMLREHRERYPELGDAQFHPLEHQDALREAQIIDVWIRSMNGTVGVLLELRQSLHFMEGDTGVLSFHQARGVNWRAAERDTQLTAWSLESSSFTRRGAGVVAKLEAGPFPGASLSIVAASVSFVVGTVFAASDPILDYGELSSDASIDGLASWGSTFSPVGESRLP